MQEKEIPLNLSVQEMLDKAEHNLEAVRELQERRLESIKRCENMFFYLRAKRFFTPPTYS